MGPACSLDRNDRYWWRVLHATLTAENWLRACYPHSWSVGKKVPETNLQAGQNWWLLNVRAGQVSQHTMASRQDSLRAGVICQGVLHTFEGVAGQHKQDCPPVLAVQHEGVFRVHLAGFVTHNAALDRRPLFWPWLPHEGPASSSSTVSSAVPMPSPFEDTILM